MVLDDAAGSVSVGFARKHICGRLHRCSLIQASYRIVNVSSVQRRIRCPKIGKIDCQCRHRDVPLGDLSVIFISFVGGDRQKKVGFGVGCVYLRALFLFLFLFSLPLKL